MYLLTKEEEGKILQLLVSEDSKNQHIAIALLRTKELTNEEIAFFLWVHIVLKQQEETGSAYLSLCGYGFAVIILLDDGWVSVSNLETGELFQGTSVDVGKDLKENFIKNISHLILDKI